MCLLALYRSGCYLNADMTDVITTTCANHPRVETLVSCSKCDKPICPKCMIFTPVGARCRECAQLRRLPQFEMRGEVRVRVLGTAAAIAILGGGALGILHLASFGLIMSMILGFAIGEALSRVSGRKQGREMEVIAGVTLVLTMIVATTVLFLTAGHVSPGAAVAGAMTTLTGVYSLLGLALGVVLAVGRVR